MDLELFRGELEICKQFDTVRDISLNDYIFMLSNVLSFALLLNEKCEIDMLD